jgi:uncharacterized protein YegP (UPF0339 family)
MTFNIFQAASGQWAFVVFSNSGSSVLSGASYETEAAAQKVVDSFIEALNGRGLN